MAKTIVSNLADRIVRLARVHFALTLVFAASIILFDAWNYITPEIVLQRWTATVLLLVVTTTVWYIARNNFKSQSIHNGLILALVITDILIATFFVYNERGMASRGVALYALPIITSAVLLRRSAIFATAAFSTAAYSWAAVRYFVKNFNEGYSIELYGTIAFYSSIFFILGALLWVALTPDRPA